MKVISIGDGETIIGSGVFNGTEYVNFHPSKEKYDVGATIPVKTKKSLRDEDTMIFIHNVEAGAVLLQHVANIVKKLNAAKEVKQEAYVLKDTENVDTNKGTVSSLKQKTRKVRKPKSPM